MAFRISLKLINSLENIKIRKSELSRYWFRAQMTKHADIYKESFKLNSKKASNPIKMGKRC
jgi:hypothetical protein